MWRESQTVSEWAQTQPGFVSRELSYAPEADKWVDVVYWETMEQAKAAAAASETAPECAPMFSLIDRGTMLFLHAVPTVVDVRPDG